MTGDDSKPCVLIVEDEPALADLYAAWLEEDYLVDTTRDGTDALRRLDETVDVVVLDRHMHGLTGDDVLATMREDGYTCPVAMVTAVEPDLDVLELDFDDYLVKPVSRAAFVGGIDWLVRRASFQPRLQRYVSLRTKRAILERSVDSYDLDRDPRYRALLAEIAALEDRVAGHRDARDGTRTLVSTHGSLEADRSVPTRPVR